MTALQPGARVTTPDGPGYVYALDGDYAAVVLDKHAGRSNAPIYWAKPAELQPPAAAPHTAANLDHTPAAVSAYGDGTADYCLQCGLTVTPDGTQHGAPME